MTHINKGEKNDNDQLSKKYGINTSQESQEEFVNSKHSSLKEDLICEAESDLDEHDQDEQDKDEQDKDTILTDDIDNQSTSRGTNDDKDKVIAELTSSLQRLQAEFDNYRKRMQKECCDIIKSSTRELIEKMLPVLDNIELAQKNRDNAEEYIKGTDMIFNQLKEIIRNQGVKEISSVGHPFDPNYHEAMMMVDCQNGEEGKVLEEFQTGYTMNDKVLRHARVKVGKLQDKRSEESKVVDNDQ